MTSISENQRYLLSLDKVRLIEEAAEQALRRRM